MVAIGACDGFGLLDTSSYVPCSAGKDTVGRVAGRRYISENLLIHRRGEPLSRRDPGLLPIRAYDVFCPLTAGNGDGRGWHVARRVILMSGGIGGTGRAVRCANGYEHDNSDDLPAGGTESQR